MQCAGKAAVHAKKSCGAGEKGWGAREKGYGAREKDCGARETGAMRGGEVRCAGRRCATAWTQRREKKPTSCKIRKSRTQNFVGAELAIATADLKQCQRE
eukprot:3532328-Pleurochrysis_carterae.AAC.1